MSDSPVLNVLVADDEPVATRLPAAGLERLGYAVTPPPRASRGSSKRWRPAPTTSSPSRSIWTSPVGYPPLVTRDLEPTPDSALVTGASGFSRSGCRGWRSAPAPVGRPFFPPRVVAQVKALACELPARVGLPLSRFSRAELRRHVVTAGIVAAISGVTIWRWLHEDALRPWSRRSWIFPRDPAFAQQAGPVLDLYHRRWKGRPLRPNEFVISADEKTQIPIRTRWHPIVPPGPGQALRVEHECRRHGVCAYLAAWDVHRARLFGRGVEKISITAFDALVADVMAQAPYRSARRVFWIVDGGTIHRGQRAVDRLQARFPNLVLVRLPTHASGLNQIEIYFSILQRKALTPADFGTQTAVAAGILGFQRHYEQVATPFAWRFTRRDLHRLLKRWRLATPTLLKAAA